MDLPSLFPGSSSEVLPPTELIQVMKAVWQLYNKLDSLGIEFVLVAACIVLYQRYVAGPLKVLTRESETKIPAVVLTSKDYSEE